jgi:hypothetical protein
MAIPSRPATAELAEKGGEWRGGHLPLTWVDLELRGREQSKMQGHEQGATICVDDTTAKRGHHDFDRRTAGQDGRNDGPGTR